MMMLMMISPCQSTTNRFRVARMLPVNLPPERPAGDDAGGNDDDDNRRQKKKKGRNKKRPRDARQSEAEQLCRAVVEAHGCKHGEACRFSHDVVGYLKRKDKVGR